MQILFSCPRLHLQVKHFFKKFLPYVYTSELVNNVVFNSINLERILPPLVAKYLFKPACEHLQMYFSVLWLIQLMVLM